MSKALPILFSLIVPLAACGGSSTPPDEGGGGGTGGGDVVGGGGGSAGGASAVPAELAGTVEQLQQSAASGIVRVIVTVRMEDPESSDGQAKMLDFMGRIRGFGVENAEHIEGTAMVVMEVTSSQVEQVAATGLVAGMEEDVPVEAN